MPHYLVLINWTEQGVREVKNSPARLDAAREAARKMGGDIKALYMVMGAYDLVAVIEAPDDAAVAKLLLALGGKGSIRTTTMRAFTEDEYRAICASVA